MGGLEIGRTVSASIPEGFLKRINFIIPARLQLRFELMGTGQTGVGASRTTPCTFEVEQTIGSPRADFHHGPSLWLNKAEDTDAV